MATVQLLLDASADKNARGGAWITPLIAAASKQRDDLVHLLLQHGADVNAESGTEGSALSQAAKAGDVRMVATLLRAGANVNGSGLPTPLYSGVESGSSATVELLLQKGADVNKGGETGNFGDCAYPLTVAVYKGQLSMVRTLLAAGANPNAQGGRRYRTALEAAIRRNHMAIFRALIDVGADFNMHGTDYLRDALTFKRYDMAQALVEAGIELREDMIVLAVEHHRGVPWLLSAVLEVDGVDVNTLAGGERTTALHMAAGRDGSEAAMRLLLEKGAYVESRSQQTGTTPLIDALGEGNLRLATLLIDHGADVNHTTTSSPLEAAVMHGNLEGGGSLEAYDMLLARGADINKNTETA